MEEGLTRVGLRLALPLIAAGLGTAALAQPVSPPRGAETAPDQLKPFIGAWDLEAVGQPRRCTVTFAADQAGPGRQIRFPATCRRALPILGTVTGWGLTPKGQPRLLDAAGKDVLVFENQGGEAGRQARGSDGQSYRLDPKGYARVAPSPPQSAAQTAAQAAQRPTVVDPAGAPAADTLPGRYAVMRQSNREACRIELSAGGVAALAPDCSDTGLTIFAPASWRYAAGRLTLVARRGHSLDLVFEAGQWRKDPNVGAPLMLRKLP